MKRKKKRETGRSATHCKVNETSKCVLEKIKREKKAQDQKKIIERRKLNASIVHRVARSNSARAKDN